MIPGSANSLLLRSAAGGYTISRSLRFNSADSAYLSRTPASAGNRKTWTFSTWLKKVRPSSNENILATNSTDGFVFRLTDAGIIRIYSYAGSYQLHLQTSAVYRDTSAWHHFVLSVDTTSATEASRARLYVNGVQVTAFSTAVYPSQNADLLVNQASRHDISSLLPWGDTAGHSSFYLADIHFCDGTAYDASAFGEFSATTGVWMPKAFTGSYGTNGFKLDFADNSAATAAALGKDTSGNGNNWTPTNLSVTAGAGNDSLIDVPVNGSQSDTGLGGEVRGNYATLNPLNKGANCTLDNGNLDWAETNASSPALNMLAQSTIAMSSGKWYCEFTATSTENLFGIQRAAGTVASNYVGGNADSWGYYSANGNKVNNNTSVSYGAAYTTNDVVGVAFDADNGTLTFYKNGVSQGQAYSGLTNGPYTFVLGNGNPAAGPSASTNFGQRPFAYTAPSGFKALCTANLPEGTITTSGSFTGNANADGPLVWLNGVPTAMTINGNAVTFGTHADKLANGFKLRTSSTSYNTSGSNTYSITTTGDKFKVARAQPNP